MGNRKMRTNNKSTDIIYICKKILFSASDKIYLEIFINYLKENINLLSKEENIWALNTCLFLQSKKLMPVEILNKLVYILNSNFINIESNYYCRNIRSILNSDILYSNNIGVIYKQYLPSVYPEVVLPEQNNIIDIKIKDISSNGIIYYCIVSLDSNGYVKKILKEPFLEENLSKEKKEIYAELITNTIINE